MAKKIQVKFVLHMIAWKATPAPPVWPILGQHGINIWAFVKEFNDKTQEVMQKYPWTDIKVPVDIEVYIDRSFSMNIMPPLTSSLLKFKSKIKSGSGEPNKQKVATLSSGDLEEIIDVKLPVMNTNNRESARISIIGTAKSMWIEVK